MIRRVVGALFLAASWVGASPCLGAGALTIEIVNGYNLVVDSNVTAPSTYGPKSAYIGAKVCNSGDMPLDNVFALVGDYGGLGAGLFPVWTAPATDTAHPQLSGTGSYSFTLETTATGRADGTRYIGTLAAGACRLEYWLISYPQCVNVNGQPQSPPCAASITGGSAPSDDLSLDYDVWATTSSVSVPTASVRSRFTMRNEISAAANKIWPNTTAKVPDAYLSAIQSVIGWATLGPDGMPLTPASVVYPGQLITTQGIWYDLGTVVHGFDNNGDLIVDQNAWLQPVGDPSSFDANCFRMVNVYGVLIVKLKTGGELLIPFENQLYQQNIPDNNGVVGLVYYQFVTTDGACAARMTPYQEAASGYDNEKFSADFGLSRELQSKSFGADLAFTKTDGQTALGTGTTQTYTAAATNNTGVSLGVPALGEPLVFADAIPSGATFVTGSADDSPATNLLEPSGTGSYSQRYIDRDGATDTCTINFTVTASSYKILYSTNNGGSWSATEPGSGVTDIRWLLSTTIALDGSHDGTNCVAPNGTYDDGTLLTSLPPGRGTTLHYQVTINATAGPVVCNTIRAGFGEASSRTTAQDCSLVTGNNSLAGVVFKDDGVGASTIFGNGTKEANEGVIGPGVIVDLYYDANGDGTHDGGDMLLGSATTNASGAYAFANLTDGPYLVVVRKYDGATSDGVNNAATDAAFGTAGWGDTTYDPNLPLTADQGILKLNEDLTTATLAVNIDLDRNNAVGQSLTNVNFAFAPPLRLTKSVPKPAVSEGEVFSYTILLENRLPSAGTQGPTGCQYTVWAPTCSTGTNPKDFTNVANACDAPNPNGTLATALVKNGGLREMSGTGFMLPDQLGAITKVEALFFGYFDKTLTDDYLNLSATFGGSTASSTVSTSQIDSYVGPRADYGPDSAISWIIARPSGGAWSWADDFSTVRLTINPTKNANADYKTFGLDALGLRITTDADCVSSSTKTLTPVPLQDRFDSASLTFVSADPPPTSVSGGTIAWDDVGPIRPGSSRSVVVTFRAKNVAGTRTGTCAATSAPANPPPANSVCNLAETAYGGKNVFYADGRKANDADGKVPVNIVGKAEIHGSVWKDTDGDGWPIEAEPALPNVVVSLYACMSVVNNVETLETAVTGKTCAAQTNGNFWKLMARAVTDASGAYEFIGLDTGTYIVEVGDTDGAPATGNASPFGGTQSAEGLDTQTVTGGTANGQDCAGANPACNNTWGAPTANLSTMNQLDATAQEVINGVNFGYTIATAALYGNVWHDIDGDATLDMGEGGLAGFTVHLYSDPNADGNPADGTLQAAATSDSSGNYSFSGLGAASFVIVVTPPTLLAQSWIETHETTGGSGSLDNRLPVTLAAGQFSGSHNFGYTLGHTSNIGDTVYFDFDGDGVQDPTELGIPSVTVRLYKDADRDGTIDVGVDDLLGTAVTDAGGRYLFQGLSAGSYVVKVDAATLPSDVEATGDPDLNTATIGGRIFFDANGDGLAATTRTVAGTTAVGSTTVASAGLFQSTDVGARIAGTGIPPHAIVTGFTSASSVTISIAATAAGAATLSLFESGIGGVVVNLYANTDGDNMVDTGEPLIASAQTGVDGSYEFTELTAGAYLVQVDTTTLPSAALARTTAAFTNVTLATNASSFATANAGYSPSANYALGTRVWSDADGDNAQDPGEVGIPGVRVTVTNGTGTGCPTGCTAITDEAGFWVVTGLTTGTYSVDVSPGATANYLADHRYFHLTAGTEPVTMTIGTTDNPGADFGYRFDTDGNVATLDAGSPTGSINGSIFLDKDGDQVKDAGEAMVGTTVNLLDAAFNIVATTATAADGTYSFTGVLIGQYAIQSVDKLGTFYTVLFLNAAQTFPNMDIIYSQAVETAADNQSAVSVDGVHDNLLQDFGYQRYQGSIGDTVFQDVNANSTQDQGEPGIAGVTVQIYLWKDKVADGGDGDGLVDAGELTLRSTAVTTADDPLTLPDEGGKYLFSNLLMPAAGQYYVVRVDTGTLPAGFVLTADPDTDGATCPAAAPYNPVCDSQQVVIGFLTGVNYLGADFGYRLTGVGHGVFGDHLWVDTIGNGTLDSGELGVARITVFIDANANGSLDWVDANGNKKWDAGEGERWVETDSDGYYVLTDLADGTYNLRVLTTDTDWPVGLATTPVYEARSGNTASLNNAVQVVVSGGAVTSIVDGDPGTTDACTNCDLDADFGYRYAGANALSGTICGEGAAKDGYCGASATTYFGVAADESPLAGIQVTLYLWNDDGDNTAWTGSTLDSGDTFTLLGSTGTNAAGDYSFGYVPNNVVVVFSVSATQDLRLTTTNANSSQEGATSRQLYEGTAIYDGRTVTVVGRQALSGLGATTRDVDFAFDGTLVSTLYHDFGDLPDSAATGTAGYKATLLASGGAQHLVTGSSIHLGSGVSTENNGYDSPGADGDTLDDGVVPVSMSWNDGLDEPALDVTASAAGWLAGWVDFNNDGDFNDAGEAIVSQAVPAGSSIVTFLVPTLAAGTYDFYARFRIYPEKPAFVSSTGQAFSASFQPTTGEVEDYKWHVSIPTRVTLADFRAYAQDGAVIVSWQTAAEQDTLGFDLLRLDGATGEYRKINDDLLPGIHTPHRGGRYTYQDAGAVPGATYTYKVVEHEIYGKQLTYGPFTAAIGPGTAAGGADRSLGQDYTREEVCRPELRAARVKARQVPDQVAAGVAGDLVKIAVTEPGVYFVSAQEIAALLGLSVQDVSARIGAGTFALSTKGHAVAYQQALNNAGLYFYGTGIDSLYTMENVYWLGAGTGALMSVRTGTGPDPSSAQSSFTETLHLEQDTLAWETLVNDPEMDYWFWDRVFASTRRSDPPKTFTFQATGLAVPQTAATVQAHLYGGSDAGIANDHHVVLSVNGQPVDGWWSGLSQHTMSGTFALSAGENTISIQGKVDAGVPSSFVLIDSFDVSYQRRHEAVDDRLFFTGGGATVVTVHGFTTPEIMVYELTDPLRPVLVQSVTVAAEDSTYSVSLNPGAGSTPYVAVGAGAVKAAVAKAATASTLSAKTNSADYVVIAPAALVAAARPLADYRTSKGLKALVVNLDDVMNEFNYGISSPEAIRSFLAVAYGKWRKAPRYVALAGDGSMDYRDLLGYGGNLIPGKMVPTDYGLAMSDNYLADVNGDHMPEMAIGRLPVVSAEELAAAIEKIKAHERRLGNTSVVLVADFPDDGGEFIADSEKLAALLPDYCSATKVYLDDPALVDEKRLALVNAINAGAGFVNYVGHAGPDQLSNWGLFSYYPYPEYDPPADDVSLLTNATQLPVLTAMTCGLANFSDPYQDTLGEVLLLKPSGGMAAVWSATGLSDNTRAGMLGRGFYKAALTGNKPVLGDAVLQSLAAYRKRNGMLFMVDIYGILGDPALRLR